MKMNSILMAGIAASVISAAAPAAAEWQPWVYEQPTADGSFNGFIGSGNDGNGINEETETDSSGSTYAGVATDDFGAVALADAELSQSTYQSSYEMDGTIQSQDLMFGGTEVNGQVGYFGQTAYTMTSGENNTMADASGDDSQLVTSWSGLVAEEDSSVFDYGHYQGGDSYAGAAGATEVTGEAAGSNLSTVAVSASTTVAASAGDMVTFD